MQESVDASLADLMSLTLKFGGQVKAAFARPAQWRGGQAAGRGVEQLLQIAIQAMVGFCQRLAPSTRTTQTHLNHRVSRRCGRRLLQLSDPDLNCCAGDTRGLRDGGNSAPTKSHRLSGRPMPLHLFVHDRSQGFVLDINLGNSISIYHIAIIALT